MIDVFIKAFIIGCLLFLPVGPVGIYSMTKTIGAGREEGFICAMGAVTMDFIYGVVAFLFLGAIKHFLIEYAIYSELLVSIIFIKVGYDKIRSVVTKDESQPKKGSALAKDYATTILMSLSNIPNMLSIIGLFTALSLYEHQGIENIFALVVGLAISEIPLWFIATYFLNRFREKMSAAVLTRIVKIAGWILLTFGLIIGIRGIYEQIQRML